MNLDAGDAVDVQVAGVGVVLEPVDVSGAGVPETEIFADVKGGEGGQGALEGVEKGAGVVRGELGCERFVDDAVDAEGAQARILVRRIEDLGNGGVGVEEVAGMRGERKHGGGAGSGVGGFEGVPDDLLVPEVDAVEHAYGEVYGAGDGWNVGEGARVGGFHCGRAGKWRAG